MRVDQVQPMNGCRIYQLGGAVLLAEWSGRGTMFYRCFRANVGCVDSDPSWG